MSTVLFTFRISPFCVFSKLIAFSVSFELSYFLLDVLPLMEDLHFDSTESATVFVFHESYLSLFS